MSLWAKVVAWQWNTDLAYTRLWTHIYVQSLLADCHNKHVSVCHMNCTSTHVIFYFRSSQSVQLCTASLSLSHTHTYICICTRPCAHAVSLRLILEALQKLLCFLNTIEIVLSAVSSAIFPVVHSFWTVTSKHDLSAYPLLCFKKSVLCPGA